MTTDLAETHIELPAAPSPRALPAMRLDPASIAATVLRSDADGQLTVDDVVLRHEMRGLVVVHRGRLAYEWYRPGSDPATLRPCFSVTKSFTGTLAALAVHEGSLDRDARVGEILPELGQSGFADATVGNLLDMTVSLTYSEEYEDAELGQGDGIEFGFNDYMYALTPEAPGSLRGLLARIGKGARDHGEAFEYATPCTDTLGWVLERTSGEPYEDLLRRRLWDRLGAETAATLALTPDGTRMSGAGLAMTTRDLARFGLLIAEREHVPADLVASMQVGDLEVFARSSHYAYLTGYSYRDQWWLPGGAGRPLSGWGIHGQFVWIDLEAELVIACHTAGADASDQVRDLDQDLLCRRFTELSAAWPD